LHWHRGLIHGDIKPANVVLSKETRKLTLIDYGSAWAIEETVERSEGDGKSAQYCAPELLRSESFVTPRADYFSLCAVCYEMLTLQVPYDGLGGRAGLPEYRRQAESTLVPPSELSPEARRLARSHWRRIDRLICRGLALDADDRFAQKEEWLDAWNETNSHLQQRRKPNVFERWIETSIRWLFAHRSQS
jgi:serine/threonine protein kinase